MGHHCRGPAERATVLGAHPLSVQRRSWSRGRVQRPGVRAGRASQRPLYVTLGWGSALKGLARVPWSQSGQDLRGARRVGAA